MPGIITGPGLKSIGDHYEAAQFANDVGKQTGLDPRVVYAWAMEETGGTPYGNFHNWLNLRPYPGDPYSGVSPGNFEEYSSLANAEAATVRRLKQPFASEILKSGGTTPAQEISAIAASGWDAGHYGGPGGPNLVAEFNSLYKGDAIHSAASGTNVSGQTGGGQTPGSLTSGVTSTVTGAADGVVNFLKEWVLRGALILVGSGIALVGLYFIVRALGAPAIVPLDRGFQAVAGRRAASSAAGADNDKAIVRTVRRQESADARRDAAARKRAAEGKQARIESFGDVPF